ncbi:MAG: sigma-54-dependent Fis family transcriptional regulator [Planctomycetes bacterium]|nr:sigma-54-dependent Fis family transcriptional regulator [Planctomycetota bacterium]
MSQDVKPRILVVDDEESVRYFVQRGLRRRGYALEVAPDGAAALAQFERAPADLVLLDLRMPGMDGFELLDRLRALDPDVAVVVMTAFGTVENAVAALRRGAFDFVTKPFEIDELKLSIDRALSRRRPGPAAVRAVLDAMIGDGAAMRELRESIVQLGRSDATVLVVGESGTGKELVARAIHAGSARAAGPFVALHCAALPPALLESELFGHTAGAFTGAVQAREGKLVKAHGGTLLLDEITEIGLPAQMRLERFLEERVVVPLGSTDGRRVDTRVIAAANRDPAAAVAAGTFRRELFFRLDVVPLRVPTLRERREDVPALVEHFAARSAAELACAVPRFQDDALQVLARYDWPGNVRELQNVVARMVVLHRESAVITAADLPAELLRPPGSADAPVDTNEGFQAAVADFERRYLEELFERTGGNVSEAARLAGLSRGHLHRKARQLGVDPVRFR